MGRINPVVASVMKPPVRTPMRVDGWIGTPRVICTRNIFSPMGEIGFSLSLLFYFIKLIDFDIINKINSKIEDSNES